MEKHSLDLQRGAVQSNLEQNGESAWPLHGVCEVGQNRESGQARVPMLEIKHVANWQTGLNNESVQLT